MLRVRKEAALLLLCFQSQRAAGRQRRRPPPPPSTKQSLEMLNNISTLTLTLNPNLIYRRESLESSLSSLFFFTKSLISHF